MHCKLSNWESHVEDHNNTQAHFIVGKIVCDSKNISNGAQYLILNNKIYCEKIKLCWFSSRNWFFCTKFIQPAKVGKRHNIVVYLPKRAKVDQQPLMHQLVILSTRWATFFHSTSDGVHHNPFLFNLDHCFYWFVLGCFFFRPDFTHSYLIHFPAFVNIVPTLVP